MQTYNNLYNKICSYENLFLAYKKARKGKAKKQYVLEFEKDLENNLLKLQESLINQTYSPKPLKTFIVRDPKLRKISKSEFEDRVIHHALCNIIEPIFDKVFIYDSYANRKGKGNSKALLRLNKFIRKVTKNNSRASFYLKCDIKHYFENINHEILISIVKKKIIDAKVINLIKLILKNHFSNLGMPLGNLTSQFFANLYLNELDYFIKRELKIKYYIRYVDDFLILYNDKRVLKDYKELVTKFLKNELNLYLHNEKSKICLINRGINFLGFRNFYYHQVLKRNKRRILKNKLNTILEEYKETRNYNNLIQRAESMSAYVEIANTYNLRKNMISNINSFLSNRPIL